MCVLLCWSCSVRFSWHAPLLPPSQKTPTPTPETRAQSLWIQLDFVTIHFGLYEYSVNIGQSLKGERDGERERETLKAFYTNLAGSNDTAFGIPHETIAKPRNKSFIKHMNINGHFAYSHRAEVISLTLGLLLAFRFVARAFCEFIYFIVFYFLLLIFSANGVCTKCIPMSSCKLQRQREIDIRI